MRSPLPICLLGLASTVWSLPSFAAEESPSVYYAAVSAEYDDAESHNLLGELGLPLGEKGWIHLGLGSSTAKVEQSQVDTNMASIGIGRDSERLELDASYAYREDSDSFEQHDLRGGLRVRMSRGSVGLDLFYRTGEDETVTSIERRRRDPLAIRIVESIEGAGIGVNGALDVTPRLRLSAAAMKYDYDIDFNRPVLVERLSRLGIHISGVTREEAYLDNSVRIGATYYFDAWSFTGRYFRDEALGSSEIADTIELGADIPLGDQWTVAPWVGYSSDDTFGDVAFGGVHLSVMW